MIYVCTNVVDTYFSEHVFFLQPTELFMSVVFGVVRNKRYLKALAGFVFQETFTRCCRLAHIKPGRPQQSYSALSRSLQRGPDSTTDSGRDDPSVHTHTSLTHKGSLDSFIGTHPNDRR